jgi:hypothetical protein
MYVYIYCGSPGDCNSGTTWGTIWSTMKIAKCPCDGEVTELWDACRAGRVQICTRRPKWPGEAAAPARPGPKLAELSCREMTLWPMEVLRSHAALAAASKFLVGRLQASSSDLSGEW